MAGAEDTGDTNMVKESGTENNSNETSSDTIISEELLNAIRKQCEFYFSDANIMKDQFLLNHVKSSSEGWMKLELVEKFKKMQKLTQDHQNVIKALSSSEKLELSPDGLLVRRKDPLPEWDRSVYYRTVIITDFPEGVTVDVASISNVFTSENIIPLLVRIFTPGKKIPPDLKRSQTLHPQLGTKLSAIVEFNHKNQAQLAIGLARRLWPKVYAYMLSYGLQKGEGKNKKQNVVPSEDPPDSRRPAVRLKLPTSRVIHIREPTKPPGENSVGFPPNWRELLRLERLLLEQTSSKCQSTLNPDAPEFVPRETAIEPVQCPSPAIH